MTFTFERNFSPCDVDGLKRIVVGGDGYGTRKTQNFHTGIVIFLF
jgi:hypothetical protein